MWGVGDESQAEWYATKSEAYDLTIRALPVCAPQKPQSLSIEFNGRTILSYAWKNCESFDTVVRIPNNDVQSGPNRLTFHYGSSARPFDLTSGRSADQRSLSVGFSELRLNRA